MEWVDENFDVMEDGEDHNFLQSSAVSPQAPQTPMAPQAPQSPPTPVIMHVTPPRVLQLTPPVQSTWWHHDTCDDPCTPPTITRVVMAWRRFVACIWTCYRTGVWLPMQSTAQRFCTHILR